MFLMLMVAVAVGLENAFDAFCTSLIALSCISRMFLRCSHSPHTLSHFHSTEIHLLAITYLFIRPENYEA